MQKILFVDNFDTFRRDFIQWFDVPGNISQKSDFILSIERGLAFPVGGENWDSLFSNLQDDETYKILKETKNKRIMLLAHDEIPDLDQKNLQIYFKILRDAARLFDFQKKQWVDYDEENIVDILDQNTDVQGFIVLFHKKDQEVVEAYL